MPPEDPYGGFIPPTMFADEYRSMGGFTIQDMLAQRQAQQRQQEMDAQLAEQQRAQQAQSEQEAQLQAQRAEAQQNFVDWPGFQELTRGTEPKRQYDGYLEALAWQLGQIGYSPEEVQQGVTQFAQQVPPPAEDFGPFGNVWESVKSGARSGTRAARIALASATGDPELIAQLTAEGAKEESNAPMTAYKKALELEPAGDPTSYVDAAKRLVAAGVNNGEGLLNFMIEQITQSYPSIAGGVAGAALGSLVKAPKAGFSIGTGIGSYLVDAGSTTAESLVSEAQDRGIDPNDTAALLQLMQDPAVKERVISDGVAHGIPVAVMDASVAAFSFAGGLAVRNILKAGGLGAGRRASTIGASMLAAETVAPMLGERAGQEGTSRGFTSASDVLMEGAMSAGPTVLHGGAGAVLGGARRGLQSLTTPGGVVPPIEPTLRGEEGGAFGEDLPSEPPPGGPPNIFDRTSLTEAAQRIEPTLTQAVLDAENKIAQIEVTELPIEQIDITAPEDRTLPVPIPGQPATTIPQTLAVTPEGQAGTPQAIEDARQQARIAALAPQVGSVDINDVQSILDRMTERGVVTNDELTRAVELIATAPKELKQDAIASVIEDLGPSLNPQAEPFALELLRIAREKFPQPKVTPLQAMAALKAVAQEIGTTPEAVMPAITQALARDLVSTPFAIGDRVEVVSADSRSRAELGGKPGSVVEILPGKVLRYVVANENSKDGGLVVYAEDLIRAGEPSVTTTTAPTAAETTPAPESEPLPVQRTKRGLKRGEQVPAANLAAIVDQLIPGGPVQAGAAPQETKAGSRRGLRAGVAAQGPVTRGLGRRNQGAAGAAAAGSIAGESITDAGNSPVRTVRGFQYGVEGTPDTANTDALQRMKEEALAKKRTGGLSKKQKAGLKTERKRGVDLAVMTKEKYEETYPGRNYDDDLSAIVGTIDKNLKGVINEDDFDETPLREAELTLMRDGSSEAILEHLATYARSPIARALADELITRGFVVPKMQLVLDLPVRGRYRSSVTPRGEVLHFILLSPRAGLDTVMHEITHAVSMKELINPTTDEALRARKKLEALMAYAKAKLPNAYGFTDVYEFVSEVFTNPDFQRALESLTLPNQSRWNAWTAFKQLVMELLGKGNNVLKESLTSAIDLISTEQFGLSEFFTLKQGLGLNRNIDKDAQPAQQAQARRVPSTAIVGTKDGARTHIAYAKGDTYTLYPTNAQSPGGVKGAGIKDLSREHAEELMRTAGSEVLAPAADGRPTPGVPKTSATKLVGFTSNGDLQVAAYEQKDGTWTYYQSDSDVRTDPDATVHKGLTKDQAQRYLTQTGLKTEQPTPNAVKPDGATPTVVGYEPVGNFRYEWQDTQAPIKAVGEGQAKAGLRPSENVGINANLRNTRVQNAYNAAREQYVEPAKKAGLQIIQRWGKTQQQIETTMQNLHTVERMNKKIQQTYKGKDDPVVQKKRIDEYTAKKKKAQDAIDAERNANPSYLSDVQQNFAPKLNALTNAITDIAAQYGRYDRDVAEAIKDAYDYYVPLQYGEKTTTGKIATGANVETDRSFARIVEQLHRTIGQGETNRVIQSVADAIDKYGIINNAEGKPVGTVGTGTKVTFDRETNSLSETVDSHTFDPNTVFFYRAGERVPLTINNDPVLLKALSPYKGADRGSAIAALMAVSSWMNRLIAVGKTSLNLAFPVGNIQRDVQAANINLPAGVSRVKFNVQLANPLTTTDVTTNTFRELFGAKPTGLYAQAKQDGAFISHRDYVNLPAIANDLDAIFAPRRSLKGINALRKRGQTKTFEALSLVSQISESVPRFAMYKAAHDSYMDGKPNTPENRKDARLFAANAAKTASVNFEQRGRHNLSSWWIFGNAKMQGLTALAQSGKRTGVTKATLGLLGITALGYLIGNAQQDGEKDKDGKPKSVKVPDYQKDNKVFLNEGGWALSLSQEITPFYILGHALSEFARGNTSGAHTSSRIFTGILNNLWPGNVPQSDVAGNKADPWNFLIQSLLPSAAVPIQQLGSNRNVWGTDVVPKMKERLAQGIPKSDMGSANENELAVNTAKGLYSVTGGAVDIAPQQLKLLHNYFDPVTETYAFMRDITGGREAKYQGDVVNPIVRKLTANATPFYDQDQFDELLAKATQAKYQATVRGIDVLSSEEQALAKSADMLHRVQKDSEGLFKNRKLLSREQIQLRQERSRELLLDGIRRYNELRDRMPKH